MRISITKMSATYQIKLLEESHLPAMLKLCQGNPGYYAYMKMQPTLENLKQELTALPQGKTLKDKCFAGYYQGEQLIAILDLIYGYPNENTAYIGWFIMDTAWKRQGIGRKIITELLTFLRQEGFQFVKLGCIKDNIEGMTFWLKNGFLPTGGEVEAEAYTVVMMQQGL